MRSTRIDDEIDLERRMRVCEVDWMRADLDVLPVPTQRDVIRYLHPLGAMSAGCTLGWARTLAAAIESDTLRQHIDPMSYELWTCAASARIRRAYDALLSGGGGGGRHDDVKCGGGGGDSKTKTATTTTTVTATDSERYVDTRVHFLDRLASEAREDARRAENDATRVRRSERLLSGFARACDQKQTVRFSVMATLAAADHDNGFLSCVVHVRDIVCRVIRNTESAAAPGVAAVAAACNSSPSSPSAPSRVARAPRRWYQSRGSHLDADERHQKLLRAMVSAAAASHAYDIVPVVRLIGTVADWTVARQSARRRRRRPSSTVVCDGDDVSDTARNYELIESVREAPQQVVGIYHAWFAPAVVSATDDTYALDNVEQWRAREFRVPRVGMTFDRGRAASAAENVASAAKSTSSSSSSSSSSQPVAAPPPVMAARVRLVPHFSAHRRSDGGSELDAVPTAFELVECIVYMLARVATDRIVAADRVQLVQHQLIQLILAYHFDGTMRVAVL